MDNNMLVDAIKKLVALPEELVGIAYDFLTKLSDPEWIMAAKKFLRQEPCWAKSALDSNLESWKLFYQKYFPDLAVDFSGLKIPAMPTKGRWRLLVIAMGLTNNKVYDACAKHFPCWRYADNLNKAVPTNERDPKNGTYAIWVRDTVEADAVHKNKSADMVRESGLKTETLLERMFHELVYFSETGNHLDVENMTLCSGSRDSDGYVPNANWNDSKFRVNWNNVSNRNGDLRAREEVSRKKSRQGSFCVM